MIRAFVIILFFSLSVMSARAQLGSYSFSSNVLYNDGYGIPWSFDFPFLMDGSPFFDTSFCKGSITLPNGKTYVDLRLKINLEQQKIIFNTTDGKAFALSQPVARLEMSCNDQVKPVVFRSGFSAIDKQHSQTLYQVLDSGKVMLLKYVEIRYKDAKAYGSNDMTRSYRQLPTYYLWIPGRDLVKAPADESELLNLLQDKRKQLIETIDRNKLKIKKESDLIRLINSYNRLS
jgi:hypothetical protein